MKPRCILYICACVLTLCACSTREKEPHRICSVDELIDSLSVCHEGLRLNIHVRKDGISEYCYRKAYWTEIPDSNFADNRLLGIKEQFRFLVQSVPHLHPLNDSATQCYSHVAHLGVADTLEYNAIMGRNPEEMLSLKCNKDSVGHAAMEFEFVRKYHGNNIATAPNAAPARRLVKQFLAEQKDVKKYPVEYAMDEGIAVPDKWWEHGQQIALVGRGADSLAAACLKGVHYHIPSADFEKTVAMLLRLSERLEQIVRERPMAGTYLSIPCRPGLHRKEADAVDPVEYRIYNEDTGRYEFILLATYSIKGLELLVVNPADVPRFFIPFQWSEQRKARNLEVVEYEEALCVAI